MAKAITIILALATGSAAGLESKPQFFCCDSTGSNERGQDVGYGCELNTQAESLSCKSEVLECPSSWTKSRRTVTCTGSKS